MLTKRLESTFITVLNNGDDFITTVALILIAVVLFELIIFFHEGGHFIAAKKSGVKVNEFALGMGPKLFSFKKGETTYSFRILPIGGYCAMEGEDEESDNPRAFNNAKIWKRMIIVVAGAVMNILFGLVLMMITLLPQDAFNSTTVSKFAPCSFTATTGLKQGDTIVEFNDYAINTSTDFSFAMYTLPLSDVDGSTLEIYKQDCLFYLRNHCATLIPELDEKEYQAMYKLWEEGSAKIVETTDKKTAYSTMCDYIDRISDAVSVEKVSSYPEIEQKETRKRFRTDMTVIRDGEKIVIEGVDFFTYKDGETDEPTLAIDFYVEPVEKNFINLMEQTFMQTVSVVRMVWGSLVGMVTGQFGINDVSGPVGLASAITDVASESLKTGFMDAVMSIVYVMMVITVNLGVVNMLPFPAFDGGRFVMLLIEAIFRKPVPRKIEGIINGVGLILLLMLMVVITFKDIWVLIFGG